MPRQSRKDEARGAKPAQRTSPPAGTSSYRLHKEMCITCPMCGLMAATTIKLEDKTEVPRFTGKPYDMRLFQHRFGGRHAAPRGTPKGKRSKLAKGVQEYTDITESHAAELQELQRTFLDAAAEISTLLEPFFIRGGAEEDIRKPLRRKSSKEGGM